ncbi:hypothetical protein AALB64_17085 [Lachnospiraceae bacterium 45-P1]
MTGMNFQTRSSVLSALYLANLSRTTCPASSGIVVHLLRWSTLRFGPC